MSTHLLHLALCLTLIGCDAKSSELAKRKELTRPVLSITNCTDGDRAMRKAASDAIAELSTTGNSMTNAIAFRILPGRGRYIVSAYWIGLEKHADGMEIALSDGSKIETLFHKDDSDGRTGSLFYSAMVFSEDLPAPQNENQPENVSTVTLTKAGKKCSNTISVTTPKDESTIWTDAIGACIEDDLELWGFAEPPASDKGSG